MDMFKGMRKRNWMAGMLAVALLLAGCMTGAMAEDYGLTTSQYRTIWANYSGSFTDNTYSYGSVSVPAKLIQSATLELVDGNRALTGETLALSEGTQVSAYYYSKPYVYVYATTSSGVKVTGRLNATTVLPKGLLDKPSELYLYLNMEDMDLY